MATTDTELQQLVINVGTEAQIEAGIASGTITSDMLSIATDGADITYDWVGTLAEYNEQNVAINHPDWLCFITDDVNNSGEDVYNNVYSKTAADEIFVAKTDNLPQYLPSLLEFKWSDCILNRVSWLRADTFSWQSGSIYEAVYEHLLEDIAGKTLQSETINDITIQYYEADDKHKICPASEENNIIALYNSVGVAWYYILDTTNERFKLPRTKFGFQGRHTAQTAVGSYIAPGLPNITGYMTNGSHSLNVGNGTVSADSALYAPGTKKGATVAGNSGSDWKGDIGFDASRSNSIYGASTTVQAPATEMYLYFYVGEFTHDAITNTAGVTTEQLNGKVDKGHEVIDFQAPTSANNYTWYRKYADGWVEQGGQYWLNYTDGTDVVLPIQMSDIYYYINATYIRSDATYESGGDIVIRKYDKKTTSFKARLTSVTTPDTTYGTARPWCWEVKGMAAVA